ncbi:GmrSD restriction endonuclease domain-containing protein [Acinetobacter sp. ANC 3791]|uniref:GmrSD restriction endonuclease domain-containing protein n=1 Tax=Acinetobacter sp. ANC 3791 TaxID=2529836 RepID=UPI00103C4175|nr:DUF262 domain-containing protein [Acinetobacter sp. ANC 3791]TCB83116.1 DUF262 domain-containing protein [Acinetobacter sp. ANC 3791]
MPQIVPSVSNPTIGNLYNDWQNGILDIQPSFQRKFVWTHKHQESFIETILNGYPFPEIYIATGETDKRSLRTKSLVIDGQQRLTTIFKYIKGDLDDFKKIPKFDKLDDKSLENFTTYKVVVRDLGKIDEDIIKEIFRRINLTNFSLEDIEIQNAIYDGDFISTAKELLELTEIFKDYEIFSEAQFSRMADLQFILVIMATYEYGNYFANNTKIEDYVIKFNEEYPNRNLIKRIINAVFLYIDSLNLEKDSIWFRKSNFFTLVVELMKLYVEKGMIDHGIGEKLKEFERNLLIGRQRMDEYYLKFYNSMFQGTNHRSSRIIRANYLEEIIRS